jgi:peptidoglycan/LPS O-acetylase OafA/YrhL
MWHFVVAQEASLTDMGLHIALLQSVIPGRIGTINGSFWSVALEVQLYLAFPAVLLVSQKWGTRRVAIVCAVLSFTWILASQFRWGTLGDEHLLPARLVQFVAGMWLADLVTQRRLPSVHRATALIAFGGLLGLAVTTANLEMFAPIAWTLPSVGLVALFVQLDAPRLSILEGFGKQTYSFYLLHQPVLLLLATPLAALHIPPLLLFPVAALSGLFATIILALPLYRLVERPTQRFSRRWLTVEHAGTAFPDDSRRRAGSR